jgi:LacI family transcriptional regulator
MEEPMRPTKRILLAFQIPETLRDVLQGISDYVKHADCKWQVECVDAHDFHVAFGKQITDGALIGLGPRSRSLITRIRRSGVPAVNVLRDLHPQLPSVLSDNCAIGRAGAAHLRERGFRQLAFVGVDTPWSRDRQAGFTESVRATGLPAPMTLRRLRLADFEYASKVRATQILRRWVRDLPRGVAAMCAADFISRTLLSACEAESIAVPAEMAILGVDNFHAVCELESVPLSSVAQDFVGMGREAAALLDRLLQCKVSPLKGPVLLPPGRIYVRKSTDILAFQDPVVVNALKIIHDHAAEGISMKELLAKTPLSRKWLDHRFKQVVGHTPSEEIRRCRLQCVHDLLIDTEMPLRQIAARGRFSCVQNLIRCFRFAYGVSPQAFRMQSRGVHLASPKQR